MTLLCAPYRCTHCIIVCCSKSTPIHRSLWHFLVSLLYLLVSPCLCVICVCARLVFTHCVYCVCWRRSAHSWCCGSWAPSAGRSVGISATPRRHCHWRNPGHRSCRHSLYANKHYVTKTPKYSNNTVKSLLVAGATIRMIIYRNLETLI